MTNSSNKITQIKFPAGTEEDALRTAAENYGAPLMDPPKSEITALVMEEFRIPCRCSTPITWVTIDMEHHHIKQDLHVEFSRNDTSRYPHVATLVFRSVSVDHVSFYYCVHNKSMDLAENQADLDNEVQNFKAVKTYLFVQGKVIKCLLTTTKVSTR